MSKNGRSRRSKIPVPIRNGDSGAILFGGPAGDNGGARPSSPGMVEPTSSPPSVSPRPRAPALTFPSTAPGPVKAAEPGARSQPREDGPEREDTQRTDGKSHVAKLDDAAPTAKMEPPAVDRDDISVPPVGLEGGFFDEPISAESSLEIDVALPDPRAVLKMTPGAARRRARFAKYVSVAVGLATALCAAALVKNTLAHGNEGPATHRLVQTAAAAGQALNTVTTTESAVSPGVLANSAAPGTPETTQPTAEPQSNAGRDAGAKPGDTAALALQGAPAAPAVVESARAAATAQEPAAPASETAPPSDSVAVDPKVVAKEAASQKAKSRGALEGGKVGDAIAAGERSVELDPTDAEAWLILGAAYQQKGDSPNALRSFKACLDKSKRGPKSDCAAMLH